MILIRSRNIKMCFKNSMMMFIPNCWLCDSFQMDGIFPMMYAKRLNSKFTLKASINWFFASLKTQPCRNLADNYYLPILAFLAISYQMKDPILGSWKKLSGQR